MKQRTETKADIEKKIDQCNRRLEELKALSPNPEKRNPSQSKAASIGGLFHSPVPGSVFAEPG